VTKTSQGIQYGPALPGKGSMPRAEGGRLCAHPGCTTILSTYNASTMCWVHSTTTLGRSPDRR
jgi:hypothetical protein